MKYIPPIGSKDADIMIIGEAPGADEEKQGKPFVGWSGILLNDILKKAGLRREDCYITNVVKVRPPANKISRLKELGLSIEDFLDDLKREIETVNPTIIVPLGNLALTTICGPEYDGITKYRGSVLQDKTGTYKVVPSIHPASCLRNWIQTHMLSFDMKRVASESKFREIRRIEREYIIRPTYQQIFKKLKEFENAPYLTVDLETFKASRVIRAIGLGCSIDSAICIPILNHLTPYWSRGEEIEIWKAVIHLLTTHPRVIAQNAKFEMTQLYPYVKDRMNIWMDTMRAHALVAPEFPHRLGFLATWYTDLPFFKDDNDGHDVNEYHDEEKLWLYCCKDVVSEHEVAMKLKDELEQLGMTDFYFDYDLKLMKALWRMEMRGIKVDVERLEEIRKNVSVEIEEKNTILCSHLDDEVYNEKFVNSPKQVKHFLYTELKLPKQYKKNGQGKYVVSTDDDAIKRLMKKCTHPALPLILQLRGLKKLLSIYKKEKLDPQNRMKTSYGLTETGRLSSSKNIYNEGMNLQNINNPKSLEEGDTDFKIRSMFVPDDGKVLLMADLWQAEAFPTAWEANETSMKEELKAGRKIHTLVAKAIFETDDPTGHEYNLGKRIVHAEAYGIGPKKGAEQCQVSLGEYKKRRDAYYERFPAIAERKEYIKEQGKYKRTIINPFGRRRTFKGRWNDDTMREMFCYVPQSTVADIINMGLVDTDAALPVGAELLLQVHDELILQCYPDQVEEVVALLHRCIRREVHLGGDSFVIPVEIMIGNNWYDKVDVEEWLNERD